MPLGLANNVAALSAYSPDWKALFDIEQRVLLQSLAGLPVRIEHIGSTAVPGLRAKPILDIGIAVSNLGLIPQITDRLIDLGYAYQGFRSEQMGHVFEKGVAGKRTHCVHLLDEASPHWFDYLALRDHLRADATARRSYEDLKSGLAVQFNNDRRAYTAGKARFIRERLLMLRGKHRDGA